ncbi:protein of unknown function [Pararobbsia alpina]
MTRQIQLVRTPTGSWLVRRYVPTLVEPTASQLPTSARVFLPARVLFSAYLTALAFSSTASIRRYILAVSLTPQNPPHSLLVLFPKVYSRRVVIDRYGGSGDSIMKSAASPNFDAPLRKHPAPINALRKE